MVMSESPQGAPGPDEGKWPRALLRFCYDFRSAKRAPQNDGTVAPNIAPPGWIAEVAKIPGVLDLARRAREAAEGAAKAAEDKGSRLAQVLLALLTVNLALGSYQLTFALQNGWLSWPTLAPVVLALIFLGLALFEALQIDRVGYYGQPVSENLIGMDAKSAEEEVLIREERGRRLAVWTSDHKHSDLMQARAWFTRGLAALLVAGIVAGAARAGTHAPPTKPTSGQTSTSSTPARSINSGLKTRNRCSYGSSFRALQGRAGASLTPWPSLYASMTIPSSDKP
jgi:hypothetical protein